MNNNKTNYSKGFFFFSIIFLYLVVFSGCSSNRQNISGIISFGGRGLGLSTVSLYRTGRGQGPQLIEETTTDNNGFFTLSFDRPSTENEILYLSAGEAVSTSAISSQVLNQQNILLATVLGNSEIPDQVVVNELTTVATAFALAQFIGPLGIDGSSPGLQNAAQILRNLVNIQTGGIADMLGSSPNGTDTSTLARFNSVANLLSLCATPSTACTSLFDLSSSPQGGVPTNTLQAAVNIAHYPWQNVSELLNLSQQASLFSPALEASAQLDAWTLVLVYEGNGMQFDGPGNIAFDSSGNAWINNNYIYNEGVLDPDGQVCGDDHVFKLSPTGENVDGSPFQGGGLYGSGFGIALDLNEDVWVSNYGFQGSNCPNNIDELARTVSKFSLDGTPLSPNSQGNTSGQDHGGFPGAGDTLLRPQGLVSDRDGNIWIPNCGNASITQFPGGDPNAAFSIAPDDGMGNPLLDTPFDMAIDTDGNAWITNNGNSSIYKFDPAGNLIFSLAGSDATDAGISFPMGIASDRSGNVWVANAGISGPPCTMSGVSLLDSVNLANMPGFTNTNASVTMIASNGSTLGPLQGGGLAWPWGIAVDGSDNVWVANFHGQRLSHLCGPRPETCPPGVGTGDPISPDGGYSSDALLRNTGVQIDPSGNVWLANNWDLVPVQSNPGGRSVAVFIGLATPVKTPLVGAPRVE